MLNILVGFVGILAGTITDIRTREVPDWINYSLIASGLGFALIRSVIDLNPWIIIGSVAGMLGGFLLGALMYYTGQWGGGDAKMIMGLGALFGLPVTLSAWSKTPLFALFLLFTIFAGAAYGVIWMFALMITKRKVFWPAFSKRMHEPKMMKLRFIIIICAILLIVIGFLLPTPFTVLLLILAAFSYITFYLSVAVKTIENTLFVKKVPVSKLVEGDWIVGEVKSGKNILVPANNPALTSKQLEAIKKSKIKTVEIKEGIPFVPSFLIAFIVAYYWWTNNLPLMFWL